MVFPEIATPPFMGILQISRTMHKYYCRALILLYFAAVQTGMNCSAVFGFKSYKLGNVPRIFLNSSVVDWVIEQQLRRVYFPAGKVPKGLLALNIRMASIFHRAKG
jgi:hypothetical protein